MMQPLLREGVLERPHDVLLPHQLGKSGADAICALGLDTTWEFADEALIVASVASAAARVGVLLVHS